MTNQSLEDRFYAGHRSALARALTLVEDHPEIADTWVGNLPPVSHATVIGITGPPGAGKSTLVNALIQHFRSVDMTVGVLAFDPSSRISGGAALGDRIRMNETWDDDGIYIRSLASRGKLGGLSDAVFGALRVLDAFGVQMILVETVGVGQGEIDIAEVADITILVQVPGTGDTIQLLKAGVLEIADILVVNKFDLDGARELLRDLRSLVTQVDPSKSDIAVVPATASSQDGVPAVTQAISALLERSRLPLEARSATEVRHYVLSEVERRLSRNFESESGKDLIDAVTSGEISPWHARDDVITRLIDC